MPLASIWISRCMGDTRAFASVPRRPGVLKPGGRRLPVPGRCLAGQQMLGRTGDIAALAGPAETALVSMPVSPVTSAQRHMLWGTSWPNIPMSLWFAADTRRLRCRHGDAIRTPGRGRAAISAGLAIPSCLAGAGRSVGGALLRRLVDLLRGEENDRLAIGRSGRGDRQVH